MTNTVDCDFDQIVLNDSPAIFTLTLPLGTTPIMSVLGGIHNNWNHVWASQGVKPVPALLILQAGMVLQALSGAELRDLGLMKIPKPE
jgi:hypothetical protein